MATFYEIAGEKKAAPKGGFDIAVAAGARPAAA
jgi:hypothetical protein